MFTFPVFSTAIAIKKNSNFFSYLHWNLPPPFTMRLRDDLASKQHQRCVKAQRNRTDLRLRVSVGFYNHGSYSWDVLLLDRIFQSCLTTDREAFATKSNGGLKGKPVSVLFCFKYLDFFYPFISNSVWLQHLLYFSNLHDSKIKRSHSRVTGKETKKTQQKLTNNNNKTHSTPTVSFG